MTPTFNMYAFIEGGLSRENKKNNGLYHLISRTMIKGYKGHPCNNLKADLDKMSSSLNPMSARNSYGLSLHGLSEHSEKLFTLFFQSLTNPLFSAKDFAQEKKMIKQELLNLEKNPSKQCFRLASQAFFPGHSYSLPITGSLSSLTSLERKKILEIHQKNLQKEKILITFSGDLEIDEVVNLINPHLENFKGRPGKNTPSKKLSPIKTFQFHKKMNREQTQIFVGFRTYPQGHKNDLYLKILTAHLAGQSSELFVNVRDQQGLCYVVQPIHFSAREGGYWGIYMASSPSKTEAAIHSIETILHKYQQSGMSSTQFERTKDMIQGQNLLNIQTNSDFAHLYSAPFLHGFGLDHHYQTLETIKKMSRENLNKALKLILSKKKVKNYRGQYLSKVVNIF